MNKNKNFQRHRQDQGRNGGEGVHNYPIHEHVHYRTHCGAGLFLEIDSRHPVDRSAARDFYRTHAKGRLRN